MKYFDYKNGQLFCESVAIKDICREMGTPVYIYSERAIRDNIKAMKDAFCPLEAEILYAFKANSNISLLELMVDEGLGGDIVSGGELYLALKAGFKPEKLVFNGNGKSRKELLEALEANIFMINLDLEEEGHLLDELCKNRGQRIKTALRINPGIDPGVDEKVATGKPTSKFGVALDEAKGIYNRLCRLKNIDMAGISCHIGSRIGQAKYFSETAKIMVKLANSLDKRPQFLDIGGGFGIEDDWSSPQSLGDFANAINQQIKGQGFKIFIEPGRSIVGKAGIVVGEVLYIKKRLDKNIVVISAAMNDMVRPALYNARHRIIPVGLGGIYGPDMDGNRAVRMGQGLAQGWAEPKQNGAQNWGQGGAQNWGQDGAQNWGQNPKPFEVVGGICESTDIFARAEYFEDIAPGDLLAILDSGAYGFSMSSNFNGRPRCGEILVSGDKYRIIRQRESYEDLL